MRKYGNILLVIGITVGLVLVSWLGFSQPAERPSGWDKGDKEGWKSETPPGWENWDEAKRKDWQECLSRATEAIEQHEKARLKAALVVLEKAARKGVSLELAQNTVKEGLDQGLGPSDFEPLGKFVLTKHQEGLKGEELAEAIHQEVKDRQAEREKDRARMKQNKGIDQPEKGKGKGKDRPEGVDEEKGKGKDKPEQDDEGKGKGKGKGK